MKHVVSTDRNLLKYFFQEYFAKKKKEYFANPATLGIYHSLWEGNY